LTGTKSLNPVTEKYQPEEILQIIRANYIQQQQYDDIALKNQDLTVETTVSDWRDICDLVPTSEFWKYLNYYFHLEVDGESWMEVLEPDDRKTLGDLCKFIADKAVRQVIEPIIIMGDYCTTAAIFKSLKRRLADRGVDVSDFRPSSQFESLVKKYRSVLIEEVNLLAPTVLPPIDFKSNWVYQWGQRLILTFVLVMIFLAYKKSNWGWAAAGICLMGYGMTWLGAWLKPKQASFNDIHTVADLVRKIDQQKPGPSKPLSTGGSLS
jgi:hypothetical protein